MATTPERNDTWSRWWFVSAGVVVGFVAGGVALRWTELWDWLRGSDWTSLPAVIVGTTIPAIAGVMFAQTIAKRSVRTLRQVELETTEAHESSVAERTAVERETRRAAWDRLYDACTAVRPHDRQPDLLTAVREEAKRIDEAGAAAAKANGEKYTRIGPNAAEVALLGAVCGVELREHLPSLIDSTRSLLDVHRVELLRVPLDALMLLSEVANDTTRWLPLDAHAVISTVQVQPDRTLPIVNIATDSIAAIKDLKSVAGRQRIAPHDADDVNTSVTRQKGWAEESTSWEESMLTVFARLADLIESDGVRSTEY